MLKIIKSMYQLNTEQLLAVYAQSLRENPQQPKRAEEEFISYLREDFFRQKNAFYAVWLVEDTYQSALRVEPYRDGLLLEALETAPNARRRGYACCLLTEVLAFLRATDCNAVYSHVNKRNNASLALHSRCGFRTISDSAVYIDGTVTQNSCTLYINLQ